MRNIKPVIIMMAFLVLSCLLCTNAFALPSVAAVCDSTTEVVSESETGCYDAVILEEKTAGFSSYIPKDSESTLCSEKTVYDVLADGMRQFKERIYISEFKISKADIESYYGQTLFMNPDLFYVSFDFKIPSGSQTVSYVVVIYLNTDRQAIEKEEQELESRISEIKSCADSKTTDIEKLLTIHDKIVLSGQYDNETEKGKIKRTAKNLLVDGKAVCTGYASAFYSIATRCGFVCGFVKNDTHIWNVVKLDGKWYHVDTTWDDPKNYLNPLHVEHKYFLKSTEWMRTENDDRVTHYGFVFDEETGNEYDGSFWNEVTSQIVSADGKIYYANPELDRTNYNFYICCADIDDLTEADWKTSLQTASFRIPLGYWIKERREDGRLTIWSGTYSALEIYDGRLYFNTADEVFSSELDGTDVQSVCRIPEAYKNTDNSVYGFGFDEDGLYYVIGKNNRGASFADRKMRISWEFLPGDINLDGCIDEDDAMLLFRYSVFPNIYPLKYTANVDFDSSGSVDIADAEYLLNLVLKNQNNPLKQD